MTDATEDRVVEAMSRAMCIADGVDPDEAIITTSHDGDTEWTVARHHHRDAALRQYRAFLAMQSVLMDLKLVQPQPIQDFPQCDHRFSPLEVMAKAHQNNPCEGIESQWDDIGSGEQCEGIADMRAAVLALAEVATDDQVIVFLRTIADAPSQGDRTDFFHDGRLLETNLVQPVSETTVPLCDHPRTGPNKYRPIAEFDETAIEIVKRYWGTTMNQCDAEAAIYFALCDAAGASKRMRFSSEEAQSHPTAPEPSEA